MKTTKQQVNALKPCSIAVYAEAAAAAKAAYYAAKTNYEEADAAYYEVGKAVAAYYAAKTNYEEAAAAAFEAVEAYEAARNNK